MANIWGKQIQVECKHQYTISIGYARSATLRLPRGCSDVEHNYKWSLGNDNRQIKLRRIIKKQMEEQTYGTKNPSEVTNIKGKQNQMGCSKNKNK